MSTHSKTTARLILTSERTATADDLLPKVLHLPSAADSFCHEPAIGADGVAVDHGGTAACAARGGRVPGNDPPGKPQSAAGRRRRRSRSGGTRKRATTKLDHNFAADCLLASPGALISSRELWEAYLTWCIDNQAPSLRSCNALTRKLRETLPWITPGGHKTGRTWRNVTIKRRQQL